MKSSARPGHATAKLAEVIQAQSPRVDNGDFGANLRNWFLKPPLRTNVTDLSNAVRMSRHNRLALPLENAENPSEAWRVDEVVLERPQADNMKDATVMLAAIEAGDSQAAEQLLVIVYDELRRLAASKIAMEAPGQTLQPTALVHEAWLRLVGDQPPSFKDREHFFRTSAEAMRRILIDRARRKHTKRHGGGYQRVDFEGFDLAAPAADDQLLALNEALDKFAVEHPVQAELVKLRYFAGLTNEEVSQVLGVSISTVKNYWTFSRAWLLNEIESNP
jgi:RNA polymerase sigma factor (TIGR02999 family)